MFAQAKTADVGELVTAFPHAYYPESSWEDDLELGATQLALAARKLGDPRANGWARDAAKWAKAYIGSDDNGTLNLYDTSALAHADLAGLLRTGVPAPRSASGSWPPTCGVSWTPGSSRRRRVHSGRRSTSPISTPPARASASRPPPGSTSASPATPATPLSARNSGTSRSAPTPGACRSWSVSERRSRMPAPPGREPRRTFESALRRGRQRPERRGATSRICRSRRAPRSAPVRMNPSTAREAATPTT